LLYPFGFLIDSKSESHHALGVGTLVSSIRIVAMDCAASAGHLSSVDYVNKKTMDEFEVGAVKKHKICYIFQLNK